MMSFDMPAGFETDAAQMAVEAHSSGAWIETALTVLFTAATVLFASFIAVITGLV
jgi:hypothetical protein